MRLFFAVMRFIRHPASLRSARCCLQVAPSAPNTLSPRPTTSTYKENARPFKESDQWHRRGRATNKPRNWWEVLEIPTQQTGRADRQFQPEPESSEASFAKLAQRFASIGVRSFQPFSLCRVQAMSRVQTFAELPSKIQQSSKAISCCP